MIKTTLRTAAAQHDGYKSPTEDRHTILPIARDVTLLSVFDGHGGSIVSEYVNQHLPILIRQKILKLNESERQSIVRIEHILRNAFLTIDEQIVSLDLEGGSTGSVAIVTATHVVVAHIGDSPVLMFDRNGLLLRHTVDHDCDNESEKQRVAHVRTHDLFSRPQAYGCVRQMDPRLPKKAFSRDDSASYLDMTRAFGDISMDKTFIIADPTIESWPRIDASFLTVASDSFAEDIVTVTNKRGIESQTISGVLDVKSMVNELFTALTDSDFDLHVAAEQAVNTRVERMQYSGDNTTLIFADLSINQVNQVNSVHRATLAAASASDNGSNTNHNHNADDQDLRRSRRLHSKNMNTTAQPESPPSVPLAKRSKKRSRSNNGNNNNNNTGAVHNSSNKDQSTKKKKKNNNNTPLASHSLL